MIPMLAVSGDGMGRLLGNQLQSHQQSHKNTPSREDPLEAVRLWFQVWDTRIKSSLAAANRQEGRGNSEMQQIKEHTQVISHLQLPTPSHGARAAQLTATDLTETGGLLGLGNDLIKPLPSPAVPQDKHTLQLH